MILGIGFITFPLPINFSLSKFLYTTDQEIYEHILFSLTVLTTLTGTAVVTHREQLGGSFGR